MSLGSLSAENEFCVTKRRALELFICCIIATQRLTQRCELNDTPYNYRKIYAPIFRRFPLKIHFKDTTRNPPENFAFKTRLILKQYFNSQHPPNHFRCKLSTRRSRRLTRIWHDRCVDAVLFVWDSLNDTFWRERPPWGFARAQLNRWQNISRHP